MLRSVRLSILEDEPGRRLHLEGAAPRGTPTYRAWLSGRLPRRPASSPDRPRYLLSLQCDRKEGIKARDLERRGAPVCERTLAPEEITGLRVRATAEPRGGLELRLSVQTRRADLPHLEWRCRVAAIDRDDEVIEFAFTLARSLGLRAYRLRRQRPADLEFAPRALPTGNSPYRSAPELLPVPPRGEAIDFRAAGAHQFVEPEPAVAALDPDAVPADAYDWRVAAWAPTQRVVYLRKGLSRGQARLILALFWGPLALLAWPFYAVFLWFLASLLLQVALFCVIVGLAALRFLGITLIDEYGTAGWFAAGALFVLLFAGSLILAATRLFEWARDRYDGSLGCVRTLDWPAHQLIETTTATQRRLLPFEDICGVEAELRQWSAEVKLQLAAQPDLRLVVWFGSDPVLRAHARSMATDLARALQVPVVVREEQAP